MGLFGASSLLLAFVACFFAAPARADQKIITRQTINGAHATRITLYIRGDRQRTEVVWEDQLPHADIRVIIRQLDQHRILQLSPTHHTYSYIATNVSAKPRPRRPEASLRGGDVKITIDSVDTGERKQVGNVIARHVRSSTRIEPSPGACEPAKFIEVDGWYIDLPGVTEPNRKAIGFLTASHPGCRDRFHLTRLGAAPWGYPVEQVTRQSEQGHTFVTKTELLEFTTGPLDPALFELPAGYRPALHTRWGDDFARSDTFANRVQYYWERAVYSARRWF